MNKLSPLVSAVNFGYRYHHNAPWVLHHLNLSLDEENWLVLSGASGSGKSTFAAALNGAIPHFHGGQVAGTLTVGGLDPADVPMSTTFRRVGVLFQDPAMQLIGTSVERELAFGLESLGLPRREIQTRIEQIATTIGIVPLLHRSPETLSGGEQQLVLLAAFLALTPQVLVLDEPMTMLDSYARTRVQNILKAIHMNTATGLVIIDHQLERYADNATSFALLEQGTITCQGTPASVITTLLHETGRGVAPPAVAQWWKEHLLPEMSQDRNYEATIPLTLQAAQQCLEQLPTEMLEQLRPTLCHAIETSTVPLAFTHKGLAPCVEWRKVTYRYDSGNRKKSTPFLATQGIEDVSGVLWPGEIVALLGPNGAGKSTLLRTLNGLVRPQQGDVRVGGVRVGSRPVADLARIVGYAPQRPERLFFCATVAEEIAIGSRMLGIDAVTQEWQHQLIESLDLEPLLKHSPFALSMGQQRRVGLAAVLASHPQVVALDEPTVGLDANARATLTMLLQKLARDGASVIVVTHDVEFAAAIASRWLVLVEGRLIADDRPAHIMMNSSLLTQAALEVSVSFQLNLQFHQRVMKGSTP